jgi:uncharacterized tellurite resistance protein B-like protein
MLAIIIFGTRGVTSTIKDGRFHCPQCDTEKSYRHRKVTQFFTLYFIPVIPLGAKGTYVECQSCRNTYIERVLELSAVRAAMAQAESQPARDRSKDVSAGVTAVAAAAAASTGSSSAVQEKDMLSEQQKAIKKLLIMMILADGKVQDSEIHMFHKVYRETTNKIVDNIYAEIDQVRTENKSPRQYLKEVSGYLNDEGKEQIIRAGMMIAKADGDVDATELEMINQFGKSLDMTPEQVKKAMGLVIAN